MDPTNGGPPIKPTRTNQKDSGVLGRKFLAKNCFFTINICRKLFLHNKHTIMPNKTERKCVLEELERAILIEQAIEEDSDDEARETRLLADEDTVRTIFWNRYIYKLRAPAISTEDPPLHGLPNALTGCCTNWMTTDLNRKSG